MEQLSVRLPRAEYQLGEQKWLLVWEVSQIEAWCTKTRRDKSQNLNLALKQSDRWGRILSSLWCLRLRVFIYWELSARIEQSCRLRTNWRIYQVPSYSSSWRKEVSLDSLSLVILKSHRSNRRIPRWHNSPAECTDWPSHEPLLPAWSCQRFNGGLSITKSKKRRQIGSPRICSLNVIRIECRNRKVAELFPPVSSRAYESDKNRNRRDMLELPLSMPWPSQRLSQNPKAC